MITAEEVGLSVRSGFNGALIMFVVSLAIIGLGVYLTIKGILKPRIRRLPGVDAIDECIGRLRSSGAQYTTRWA